MKLGQLSCEQANLEALTVNSGWIGLLTLFGVSRRPSLVSVAVEPCLAVPQNRATEQQAVSIHLGQCQDGHSKAVKTWGRALHQTQPNMEKQLNEEGSGGPDQTQAGLNPLPRIPLFSPQLPFGT
jgi:hypothetical protein